MLTKQDLEAINKLLDKKFDQQEHKMQKQLQSLTDKVEDLEIKFEDKIGDLNMAIFQVKAELRAESTYVKKRLNKIYDQETIIKFFNEEYLRLLKRVEKIESQINISAN